MKKIFVVSLFCVLWSYISYSQRVTSFSAPSPNTPEEMKALFETAPADRKKEMSQLMENFAAFWQTSSAQLQNDFVEISNEMLKARMRAYPQFTEYIKAYINFDHAGLSAEYLENWKKILRYHIQNDKSAFEQKMEMYAGFFTEKYLKKTTNSSWMVVGEINRMDVEKEPFISFQNIDLYGFSKSDTLIITSTSGIFYPSGNRWEGKGGFVYWDRAGLSMEVKAQLADYNIDTRFPKLEAENVLLYYPKLFAQSVKGKLEEKATVASSEEKASYPRFKSYDNYLSIPNIYKQVDYIGGFEMRGANIMGSSDGIHLAKISIKKDNKIVVSVESKSFLFRPGNVLSTDAAVSVYLEEDSLYHTAADVKFSAESRELLVSRPKNGPGRAPFVDSYHKMEITAEAISWKIDEATIEIKPVVGNKSESSAVFESLNYFDYNKIREIQGINDENPLMTLWKCFRSYKYADVHLDDVVAFFKKSSSDIKQLLIDLAANNFVEYDMQNNMIRYHQKIANYLNNWTEKKDYDYIKLESKNHYASIDLMTNDLRITGCEFFIFSDPQIVNVYPAGEKVTVKKNRDMVFSGRVIGGLFDFVTHNCSFNYDKFEVKMDVIDSMFMYVEDKATPVNMYGEHRLRRLTSQIEELAGTLCIDRPGNKSGIIDDPNYPYFESRKQGKVFYDQKFNNNGAYKRDQFYYVVDLFKIYNLDNFVTDSMKFNGYLVSGGIFPDIHEKLVTRPDFSLGFVYKTGNEWLPMYGGKGSYNKTIDLSNKGLRGRGDIKYITSITKSDSLIFFLDATRGRALEHTVAEQLGGTEYPKASVDRAALNWEAYKDRMFIHTQATPIHIFDEVELTGYSKLTPSGLYGNGISKFKRADLTSKNFWFKHHELLADTADMRIFDLKNADNFAFITNNYNSHVDFQTRKGEFIANGNASEVFFVKNEMKATSSRFDWDNIDKNVLRFKWEDDPYKDVDINNTLARELIDMKSKGNELMATNPDKHGLHFCALSAEFDFGENIIKAHGVRYIHVGDGAIFPNNGDVTIYEKARLAEFTKSRLLVGRENKYHELYDGRFRIETATKFFGNGYYDYVDENKTTQTFYFDTVGFYNTTIGHGKIPADMNFKFSPYFGFSGRVELHSDKPFLYYVGGVEFVNDCDSIKPTPLRILQEVDPNNILIEIHDRSRDITDRKAVVAIASRNRDGRIYTAFGAAKDQFNDAEYINVWGYIKYDKEARAFKAASLEKLQDESLPGNIIIFDVFNCITTGRGTIDMGTKLGRVAFYTNGTIENYMQADSADMNLITSIDFFFNTQSMKIMSKALQDAQLDFVETNANVEYDLALQNMLGKDAYQKYMKEVNVSGRSNRLPKELQVQFFFSDLYFSWDKERSAFVSQSKLPLVICGGEQIYKTVPGRIVVEKKGSRNKLYINMEVGADIYFFQFENNTMYGYSSNKKFTDEISNTKSKNKIIQADKSKDLPAFSYRLGRKSQYTSFVKKYGSIEEEESNE